jgi:hypothetical protein
MTVEVIKFDPARPHAIVLGQPGLAYQQDGHTFNGKGDVVTPAEQEKLQPVDAPEPKPTPDDGSIPRCYMANDETEKEEVKEEIVSFESMHWKKLQKLCVLYGIDYVDREQAIAALKGR